MLWPPSDCGTSFIVSFVLNMWSRLREDLFSFSKFGPHVCVSPEGLSWAVDVAGLGCEQIWFVSSLRGHDKNSLCWECVRFIAVLAVLFEGEQRQIERAVQEGSGWHWQMFPLFQNLCNLLYFEMNNKLTWLLAFIPVLLYDCFLVPNVCDRKSVVLMELCGMDELLTAVTISS